MPELSPEALREYQLLKLRETFDYVKKRGRFYRGYFSAFDSIESFDAFQKLPFTTPADISRSPNDFLCVPPDEISRIVTLSTSGTTGNSKRIFFTSEDQELTIDFFHHGMSTLASPRDRVLISMPGRSPGGVCDLLARGLDRLGAVSRVFGPAADQKDMERELFDFCPDVIVGTPLVIYQLASNTAGIFHLKSVLLASDYIPRDYIPAIESAWKCKVFSHYGMTETGLGGAVSCGVNAGYHMREADLYFEVIDPITGRNQADGEYGEIVFSTLNRRGMPLLRYRTGDSSRMLVERCPCGSCIRRFDHIADRGMAKRIIQGVSENMAKNG